MKNNIMKFSKKWVELKHGFPITVETHNICGYLHRTYTILDLLTKLPRMRRELRLPYPYLRSHYLMVTTGKKSHFLS